MVNLVTKMVCMELYIDSVKNETFHGDLWQNQSRDCLRFYGENIVNQVDRKLPQNLHKNYHSPYCLPTINLSYQHNFYIFWRRHNFTLKVFEKKTYDCFLETYDL